MSYFSEHLKKEMNKAGLRATDIAKATGLSRATISQYLSGLYTPKGDNLLKIATVLHVKPSSLIDWDKKDVPPFQNLLECLFQDEPEFLEKISNIDVTGKINEPGIVAQLTKRQQERIKDIIILTYNEAIQNAGTATVKTVPAS